MDLNIVSIIIVIVAITVAFIIGIFISYNKRSQSGNKIKKYTSNSGTVLPNKNEIDKVDAEEDVHSGDDAIKPSIVARTESESKRDINSGREEITEEEISQIEQNVVKKNGGADYESNSKIPDLAVNDITKNDETKIAVDSRECESPGNTEYHPDMAVSGFDEKGLNTDLYGGSTVLNLDDVRYYPSLGEKYGGRTMNIEELRMKLKVGMEKLCDGEEYRKTLEFASHFPKYSIINTILIRIQISGANETFDDKKWQGFVEKIIGEENETQILIYDFRGGEHRECKNLRDWLLNANGDFVDENNGELHLASSSVSDIFRKIDKSQLQEKYRDIYSCENVEKYNAIKTILVEVARNFNLRENYWNKNDDTSGNSFSERGGQISTDVEISNGDKIDVQTLIAVIQEIARAALNNEGAVQDDDHNASIFSGDSKEMQVQSVSYLICLKLGIEASLGNFDCIGELMVDGEGRPDYDAIIEILSNISNAARRIFDALDRVLGKLEDALVWEDINIEEEETDEEIELDL